MKLIILNGPSGVGKSTLAARLNAALPLSLLLDIDQQRRFVGAGAHYSDENRELTLRFCFAAAEAHLKSGHAVIIDKIFRYDDSPLAKLVEIGTRSGADVYEFILNATKETVIARAHARGFREGGTFTPQKVEEFWDQIQAMIPRRPSAIVIETDVLDAEALYREVGTKIGLHL